MSQYIRVVLEGDTRGRASISALGVNGAGHGYRLAGPKYIGDIVNGVTTPKTFEVELDERDVVELHSYLRIWDEINLGDEAPEWSALIEASDRYRRAVTDLARVRTYPDFPAKRIEEIGAQREQARLRLVQAAGALAEVSATNQLKSV
jgi:hypothetical protein